MAKHHTKLFPDVIDSILDTIIEGNSLRSACRDHGVSHGAFLQLVNADAELANRYARARDICMDVMAEEILDISDDGSRDWVYESTDDDGNGHGKRRLDNEHVQRSKLRVDARKWLLAKMAPKKYGDRVTQSVEGGDKPVSLSFTWADSGSGGGSD